MELDDDSLLPDAIAAVLAVCADKIERLQSALKKIASEADAGRLSANDDELRDWLMAIRDTARAAVEQKDAA